MVNWTAVSSIATVVAALATAASPAPLQHSPTIAMSIVSAGALGEYVRNTSIETMKVVGATGFEPATPCAQGRCATRLRYAPTLLRRHCRLQISELLIGCLNSATNLQSAI